MRVFLTLTLIVFTVALTTGCESRITGKEGLLSFAYTGPGDSADFNRPIAVGARQELRIREAVNHRPVTVVDADTDPTDILEIEEIRERSLILLALSEGRTEIRASAELSDGEVVEDFVDMRARVADRLTLRHSCVDGDRGLYLADTEILIPFGLYAENDERLTGYGLYPITTDPEGVVELSEDHRGQFNLLLTTAEERGTTTVSPEINGDSIEIEIVLREDINSITVVGNQEARVNHSAHLWPELFVDDEKVCQTFLDYSVEVLTPDTCEILSDEPEPGEDDEAGEETLFPAGWVTVEGRSPGECRVLYSLADPALATEAVVTITE